LAISAAALGNIFDNIKLSKISKTL